MDEELVESCARAAHEVNRAYCAALGDSQPSWEEAPFWQKDSLRAGARSVLLGGPDHTPEASHEGWMAQKLAEGWVYGEVKDTKAKTHPCIVPYRDLPREQQAKDHIFMAVVRQVAQAIR